MRENVKPESLGDAEYVKRRIAELRARCVCVSGEEVEWLCDVAESRLAAPAAPGKVDPKEARAAANLIAREWFKAHNAGTKWTQTDLECLAETILLSRLGASGKAGWAKETETLRAARDALLWFLDHLPELEQAHKRAEAAIALINERDPLPSFADLLNLAREEE